MLFYGFVKIINVIGVEKLVVGFEIKYSVIVKFVRSFIIVVNMWIFIVNIVLIIIVKFCIVFLI